VTFPNSTFEIHSLFMSGRAWPDLSPIRHRKLLDDLREANAELRAAQDELGAIRDVLGIIADRSGGVIEITQAEQVAMTRGRTVHATSDARDGVMTIEFEPRQSRASQPATPETEQGDKR
jgi:hypothetical protein